MTRIKRGNVARKRRKKILRLAKGFRGSHSKLFRTAKQQVLKALKYSYIGRKNKKRNYRRLWIIRINAAVRSSNLSYSEFMYLVKKSNIALNRKMLAQLAFIDNSAFSFCINFLKSRT
uniref:Large ribosomal subunit protein bL20c n=1 Tax=Ophidocladus simpliciusculus TaxID=1261574 RepID=A0A1Z1MIV3_9FLOR|nr:ribosomal protein L20 [Ophidocladus simpliciusculus]ARW66010.1 ribosomal protein L20 [Ophidocladus simpliciusculus]